MGEATAPPRPPLATLLCGIGRGIRKSIELDLQAIFSELNLGQIEIA